MGFTIDDNPEYKKAIDLFKQGEYEKVRQIEKEFIEGALQEKDHCPCTVACRWHGKCKECVMLHRGHQDHLPKCMQGILLKQLQGVAHLAEIEVPEECADCKLKK